MTKNGNINQLCARINSIICIFFCFFVMRLHTQPFAFTAACAPALRLALGLRIMSCCNKNNIKLHKWKQIFFFSYFLCSDKGEITKPALAAFYRSVIGLPAKRVAEIIDTAYDRMTSVSKILLFIFCGINNCQNIPSSTFSPKPSYILSSRTQLRFVYPSKRMNIVFVLI